MRLKTASFKLLRAHGPERVDWYFAEVPTNEVALSYRNFFAALWNIAEKV